MKPRFVTFQFSNGRNVPSLTDNPDMACVYETESQAQVDIAALEIKRFGHVLMPQQVVKDELGATPYWRLLVVPTTPDEKTRLSIRPVRFEPAMTGRSDDTRRPAYVRCSPEQAECFGLYLRNSEGLDMWVNDYSHVDAAFQAVQDIELRRWRFDSISQTSGAVTHEDTCDWADLLKSGFFDGYFEVTPLIVLNMKIGETLLYGGGAAPLMQITCIDVRPDLDVRLTNVPRTYINQFDPSYAVSPLFDDRVTWGYIVDSTWGNDAAPSFEIPGKVRIWVDHPDPAMREMNSPTQYSIVELNKDGEIDENGKTLLETDDLQSVIQTIEDIFFADYVKSVNDGDSPACPWCDSSDLDVALDTAGGRDLESKDEAVRCNNCGREWIHCYRRKMTHVSVQEPARQFVDDDAAQEAAELIEDQDKVILSSQSADSNYTLHGTGSIDRWDMIRRAREIRAIRIAQGDVCTACLAESRQSKAQAKERGQAADLCHVCASLEPNQRQTLGLFAGYVDPRD